MHQSEATETSGVRRRGRALLAIATIGVAGVLVAGCGDDDTADVGSATTAPVTDDTGDADGDAPSAATTIDIVSIAEAFDPGSASVAVGDEVTWVNTDGVTHTTTAEDGAWDSGNLAAGEEFSFTPEEAGTYDYVCSIHPSMRGELVVE